MEAVMKLAASAASTSRRPLAPLDFWILVSLEAVLAADLITASMSLHVPTAANPFLDPAA